MRNLVLKRFVQMQLLRAALKENSGQDMVEYAIVMGLIALGATASMQGLAGTIATVFDGVGTKLSSYTT